MIIGVEGFFPFFLCGIFPIVMLRVCWLHLAQMASKFLSQRAAGRGRGRTPRDQVRGKKRGRGGNTAISRQQVKEKFGIH